MKKTIILALILTVSTFAQGSLEHDCSATGNPEGSCIMDGFVCNLGFGVAEEKSAMFFNIGLDTTCGKLQKSDSLPTYPNPDDTTIESQSTKFFLIEDEYNAGPLSLTLAGSMAMSASLNGRKVSIIYKRVKLEEYGGIRLLSIRFFD